MRFCPTALILATLCAYRMLEVDAFALDPHKVMTAAARGGFLVVADRGLAKVFFRLQVPAYPYEARRDHWSGSGIYRAFIAPSGKVLEVKVIKSAGYRVLDESVEQTARQWKAKPGRNREVDFSITFLAPPRKSMPGYGY